MEAKKSVNIVTWHWNLFYFDFNSNQENFYILQLNFPYHSLQKNIYPDVNIAQLEE